MARTEERLNGATESAVLYPNLHHRPSRVVGSQGIYLMTEDGRKILDATCGAAVSCLGHNNSRVIDAVSKQMRTVDYCYGPFFTSGAAESLSRLLSESTGSQLGRVYLVSSGAESVEAAIKFARQYFLELPQPQPQRIRFISRRQSYHGNTLGALSLGSHQARKAPYLPILSTNISYVSPCYAYRGQATGESDQQYVSRLAQELEDEFQAVGPDTVCAFIAETVSGTTLGSVPPVPGYFRAMKQVCERFGALFILDEVMSGMGRTGTLHAWEQEGVVPDLQTVAKGLGAGFIPLGALLISQKLVETLERGSASFIHSQTYQGHPVACAAAFEVQSIIREENLLENVQRMGALLEKQLRENLQDHPHVGDVRGRGLLWGVEFVQDKHTREPFPAHRKVAASIHQTGLSEFSVSVIPGTGVADGINGDIIQIAPPYNVTSEEIKLIVERTTKAIIKVLGC